MHKARWLITILAAVGIVLTVSFRILLPGPFWHLRGQVDSWIFVAAVLLAVAAATLWLAVAIRRVPVVLRVLLWLFIYAPVTLFLLLEAMIYGPIPERVHFDDGRYVITELVADDGIPEFLLSRREGLVYRPLGYTRAYYPQEVQITGDEENGWVIVNAESPLWNRPDTLKHTTDTLPWDGEEWLDRRRRR